MSIQTYKDVSFPFDTEMVGGSPKVRLLAAVGCDEWGWKIIGYTYHGDDPLVECAQTIAWDAQGTFADGQYREMNLVPPPGAVEAQIASMTAEVDAIRLRLAENPNAPLEWRSADERRLASIEKAAGNLRAPHIWDRAA